LDEDGEQWNLAEAQVRRAKGAALARGQIGVRDNSSMKSDQTKSETIGRSLLEANYQ
jgi:hypothetical protein